MTYLQLFIFNALFSDIFIMGHKLLIREDKENMENKTADNHYFEGVEKLLEVWFKKENTSKNKKDLRDIPR